MIHWSLILALLALSGCVAKRSPERTVYPDYFVTRELLSSSHPHLLPSSSTDGVADPVEGSQEFMTILFHRGMSANLLRDAAFCRKWFTPSMRHDIAMGITQADHRVLGRVVRHDDGHPLFNGSSGTILYYWNPPTSFRSSGHHSSATFRTENNRRITQHIEVCDFVCHWGASTQYPGDERLVSVMLTRDGRRWFISEVYVHSSASTGPSALSRSLFK